MTAVGLMGMTALTACGSGSTDSATSASAAMTPSASSTPRPPSTLSGTVTVLAAASSPSPSAPSKYVSSGRQPGRRQLTISFGSRAALSRSRSPKRTRRPLRQRRHRALDQLPPRPKAKPT